MVGVDNIHPLDESLKGFRFSSSGIVHYQTEFIMSKNENGNGTSIIERIRMPRPTFVPPTNPMITPTLKREVPIGVPLNRTPLPPLNLPSFGGKLSPSKPRASKEKVIAPVAKGTIVSYTSEDVCSDENFIMRTRAHTIHDPGMKALFFANGGVAMYQDYDTLAQAFDALRRTKMMLIAGLTPAKSPYERVPRLANQDITIYVPGKSVEETIREREGERTEARRRQANQEWLAQPLTKKTG